MNLQPLYDIKDRLEYAAIAGTGLLAEDFRLQRAAESLKPLAAASPVFAKIDAALQALLAAPAPDRPGLLLDTLALVDAVAYTQGRTGVEGDLEPLPAGVGTYQEISASQLGNLLAILGSTGGSGRLDIIRSTWEDHPAYFSDFRVLPEVVAGLGDGYHELAEFNATILKQLGPVVLPLLKQDFDPAGKRAMARRVEVLSAVEGPDATPWLKSILPQAKKDVRIAVLSALGRDPDNVPLLLELAQTERGKNREAVLQGLALHEGEAVRAFWEQELAQHSESVSILQDTAQDWASDLVAEGLKTRLTDALAAGKPFSSETHQPLTLWLASTTRKASPAMLGFWRWADERLDDADRLERAGGKALGFEEPLTAAFLHVLLFTEPGPLCALCLELWERNRNRSRWLTHAVAAALLTRSAAEVYETFSPYVLTSRPLLGAEKKKALNDAVLRGLRMIHGGCTPAQPLDARWIERLTHAAFKTADGRYSPFAGPDEMDGFDTSLMYLANPADPAQCAQVIPYFRKRMAETGSWYSYGRCLLRFRGSPAGVLKESICASKNLVYLYHMWEFLNTAYLVLPAGDVIELCREVMDANRIRGTREKEIARQALPWTILQLKDGQPFPSWDRWWKASW